VVPSVLIVSEELDFLLACYTTLHRDARLGQIEATTSSEEGGRLVQTLRPDAVVFDTSAGDGVSLSAIRRLRELAPYATVLVTFRKREAETINQMVEGTEAAGVVSRDGLSAEVILRFVHNEEAERVAALGSPA
jgi:DNA-binding NarL/FixJ family response regulator